MSNYELAKEMDRGFVQGVAWAVALLHQYPFSADGMLNESGLRLNDFIDAKVAEGDLRHVKAAAKIGGVWDRKRANNGDPDTIVPAPAPLVSSIRYKLHPGHSVPSRTQRTSV
jgi:hypothetical protein